MIRSTLLTSRGATARSTRTYNTAHVYKRSPVIIYRASKSKFLDDALSRDIEDVIAEAYRDCTETGVAPR
jgi:hypothetical protein